MTTEEKFKELEAKAHGNHYIRDSERFEKIEIKDIPILRCEDGRIICFAKERVENIKIGIFGSTGSGKTTLTHAILDRMHHNWNMSCCITNDYQSETDKWILRNQDFLRELRILNEVPYPLPLVHVYPHNKDTPEEKEIGVSVPFIRMTIPFKKVIEKFERYITIKESTLKYLNAIKEKLIEKEFQDFKEVDDMIDEEIEHIGETVKKTKTKILAQTLEATKYSIKASLGELRDGDFLDVISNKKKYEYSGTPSSVIKIKNKDGETEEGPIFSMLMKYGLVPCLRTEDLLHLRYAEPMLSDLHEEIFKYPRWMGYNKRCVAFIPELSKLMKFKEVVKKIEEITGRGRAKGVGLVYDTHTYPIITDEIRQNTVYAFAFSQKADTAQLIKKDFDLSEGEKLKIINLKQFQCLAISSKGEKWAVYDENGNRELISGTFRGYALPSLGQHSKGMITGGFK